MSTWLSLAQVACGPPKPRNGPAGVVVVITAEAEDLMCFHRYGPGIRYPAFSATSGLPSE